MVTTIQPEIARKTARFLPKGRVALTWLGACCGAFALGTAVAFAQSQPLPAPETWLGEITAPMAADQKAPPSGRYVGRVVLLLETKDHRYRPIELKDQRLLRQASFLDVTPVEDLVLSRSVNQAVFGASRWNDLPSLVAMAGADAAFVASGKGWRLVGFGPSGDQVTLWQDQKIEPLAKLMQRLTAGLGYDAAVIEQRESLILAQTPNLVGREGLHAMLIRNSAEALVVPPADDDAAALLELVKGGERFSVFKLLASETAAPFPFATKIVLAKDPKDTSGQ